MLSAPAYAKVNLSLEVLGKRSDGFHALITVMQTVSLCDVLTFSPAEKDFTTSGLEGVSTRDNLVWRAAHAITNGDPSYGGMHIHLEKNIPCAAGLGGGSSDAAVTLLTLRQHWDLPGTCEDVTRIAASLGSDVPFFLFGGTALVEGRGEIVTPLPASSVSWFVLANPGIAVPTQRVFGELQKSEWTDGSVTRQVATEITHAGPLRLGHNSLQAPMLRRYPQTRSCLDRTCDLTNGRAIISGSGGTVVGLCSGQETAQAAALKLVEEGYWATAAHSVSSTPVNSPCRDDQGPGTDETS